MPSGGIYFFSKLGINFLLNDKFINYVYSYHSEGIYCEHWLIHFLLKSGPKGDGVGEN